MRWGRAIRTLLVFVLLGAIATVLPSWAIHAAYFWRFDNRVVSRVPPSAGMHTGFSAAEWDAIAIPLDEVAGNRGFPEYMSGRRDHLGWERIMSHAFFSWAEDGEDCFHFEILTMTDCGWPAMSLRQWYYQRDQDRPRSVVAVAQTPGLSLRGGIQAWPDAAQPYYYETRFALPLLPLWPGFAINTAVYAALLFVALRMPGVIRRALRRRRERCTACGYDCGGLDAGAACPECGAQADARATTKPTAAT